MPIRNKINAHYAHIATMNAIAEYQKTDSFTNVLDSIYLSVRKSSNLGNTAVVFDFSDLLAHGYSFGIVSGSLGIVLKEDGFFTNFVHSTKKRKALVLIDWSGNLESQANKK